MYTVADERWEMMGMKSFDDFSRRLVVSAKFHEVVPKDIIEEYKTAEFMMAYAYYYYPLYHEAFSKVLRITEMAVKIKCRALGH